MAKGKSKLVDHAEPTVTEATRTDAEMGSVAYSKVASMALSPLWAGSPDVQTAAKGWSKSADDLAANAKVIAGLKDQLSAAEAKQLVNRRSWRTAKRQVLIAVCLVCAGSADQVKAFSFGVITRVLASLLAAVTGITTALGKVTGSATAKWPRGLARHGFLVQHATDPANAATYSGVIPCTKSSYTITGAPSASVVYFRVAAIDPQAPAGQAPWSSWVAATVR